MAQCTFEYQIHEIILINPAMYTAIKSHGMDERSKILMARDEFDINKLTDNQYLLFKQTWCRTNLLKIENKALKFPPPKKPG